MRTPLIVVTGIDPSVIDCAMLSLTWDVPNSVMLRHSIDPDSQILTRILSHQDGILERVEIPLAHACVACALREDIVPTLQRLADDPRWHTIIAALPAATEADRLGAVLAADTVRARKLRLASVVCALDTTDLARDLLSDDLLYERGWHCNPFDKRGVGETACAQVEYADRVILDQAADRASVDLVRALVRPGVRVDTGYEHLQAGELAAAHHHHETSHAWHSPILEGPLPALGDSAAWRLDLSSDRALHPERMLDLIGSLGGGNHRSRGCFWVPTRPGMALEWSGAGGQLSIGSFCSWGRRTPWTRLVFTGLGETPATLLPAFEAMLLTPAEAQSNGWQVSRDGLEPWLGDIRDVA